MTPDQAVDIIRETLYVALVISAPILAVGLVIGLVISLFQAVTQIQEQTLTFVPKIVGMVFATIFIVPWAGIQLLDFAGRMFAWN